jgi:prepilin-type processing-associated H-X9-DG protein
MNVKQGSVLVPAFLDPRYPRPSWRAHPPSLGITRDLGATHFVGVAGIGQDAADYSASDPTVAKKLGVFGYERRTNAKDIADGLSNTIFMIQVPPTHQRPWIAGGGATVVGIPESRSIAPFVVTEGGKRGAHVLMCDGSVRFIRDDVSDDVMKALCTIKGGEAIADVNSVAPKVDPPKGPALKTAASAKAGGE